MGEKSKKKEKRQLEYQYHRKGGKEIRFLLKTELPVDRKGILREALETVFALEKVDIRVHSMGLELYMLDNYAGLAYPSDDIEKPFYQFRDTSVEFNKNIDFSWVGEVREEVDDFSISTLEKRSTEILEDAIRANTSEDGFPEWVGLYFGSVSMPTFMENIEPNIRIMRGEQLSRIYPLLIEDDAKYIAGPLETMAIDRPMEMRMEQDDYNLELTFYLRWSYFTEEGEEGYIRLQTYFEYLKERGWVQMYPEV